MSGLATRPFLSCTFAVLRYAFSPAAAAAQADIVGDWHGSLDVAVFSLILPCQPGAVAVLGASGIFSTDR